MTYTNSVKNSAFIFALSILLTACGGGGSDTTTDNTNPTDPGTTPPDTSEPDPVVPVDIYAWEKDKYLEESSYKGRCSIPRTGTTDVQGTELDEKFWLRSWNNSVYLWYKDLVDQDPNLAGSPTEYFSTALTSSLTTSSGEQKDSISTTVATSELSKRIRTGLELGYGMKLLSTSDSLPRETYIAYTQPNSPASIANIPRGAQIIEIDGVDYLNATTAADLETISTALAPATSGESHTFKIKDTPSAAIREVTLTSEDVVITPITSFNLIGNGNNKVGYIALSDNIDNAIGPLIESFNTFKQEQVNDLVLDLRYNTGGALYVSTVVASLISGKSRTENKIFSSMEFNDKHPKNDPFTKAEIAPEYFYNEVTFDASGVQTVPRLELDRVFVLTGENTCAASELIINGLKGVDVQVVGIGANTCGQPYGAVPVDNCGTTYISTNFKNINEKGTGNYTAGFTPVCKVSDDLTKPLGDELEARLAAALEYRTSGTCPSPQAQVGTETLLNIPTWQKALIVQ